MSSEARVASGGDGASFWSRPDPALAAAILARADARLLAAKRAGRGRSVAHDA